MRAVRRALGVDRLSVLDSGMVILIVAGIVCTPVVYRLMHHVHWDDDEE